MSDDRAATSVTAPAGAPALDALLERYGCGPVRFTGTQDALYERHLLFEDEAELVRTDDLARDGRQLFVKFSYLLQP